ncbi:hypothetical protein OAJ44_02815 [Chloroflexi bacterium]|nr:hypothetical protein [Chloroflexota bacterium]
MKVSDITIEVIERELPDTGLDSDLGRFSGTVDQGVLRISTDEGIEGNCFLGEFRKGSTALHSPILTVLKPELIGVEVSKREWLWSRLQILSARKGINMSAWSPIDIALWDAAGKQAGMPIHELLGNQRNEISAYATYPPRHVDVDGYVAEAEEIIAKGFKAYKIHPGVMETDQVVKMVGMVRDQVGPQIDLMLDPNCGYDYRKALDIGQALDENGFYWYEDPVSHFDLDSIKELTRRLKVPICMSDQADNQFYWGANAIRTGSNRLLRGSAAKLGITGLKKLCSMAEGFGYNCEIGTAGNSLMNIANLHVIYSVTNCAYYEYWMPAEAHQFGLINDILLDKEGVILATNSPGLGYQIDWDYIEKHRTGILK